MHTTINTHTLKDERERASSHERPRDCNTVRVDYGISTQFRLDPGVLGSQQALNGPLVQWCSQLQRQPKAD